MLVFVYLLVLPSFILESHHEEQYNVKWKQNRLDQKFVLSMHVGL